MSNETGGVSPRQTAAARAVSERTYPSSPSSPAAMPRRATGPQLILLDDEQAAAVYGVGVRTFLEMQKEPWFPAPRMLGPRLKRHVYSELMEAVSRMPRYTFAGEPSQLLRGKIERLKRSAPATGQTATKA